MNEIMLISQQLMSNSLQTKFGDGSRYGVMLDEYSTHFRAYSILNQASKQDQKISLSTTLMATYILEIGLKCLSFISHEGKIYSKTNNEYNSEKTSLPTGIYKINKGNHIEYRNIVQPSHEYKLTIRSGKRIKNSMNGTDELIKDKLMELQLSQDELFAIFKEYAPYPKTHKYIDIFESIKSEYQQNIYDKFKNHFCYYLINYTTFLNNVDSIKSVEALQFNNFKDSLKELHNFVDFRYVSGGSGNICSHGGLLSSLNEAVRDVLLEIEKATR